MIYFNLLTQAAWRLVAGKPALGGFGRARIERKYWQLRGHIWAYLQKRLVQRAYPKIPKWHRKNPGECFNAGFFRCLGYNFGICSKFALAMRPQLALANIATD
jgi:hypothetical protein